MKTVDLQELGQEPAAYAEKLQAGEEFTLTYRGRVIVELRRCRVPDEAIAGAYGPVLDRAGAFRVSVEEWQHGRPGQAEDSVETLRRLRDENDLGSLR